MASGVYNQLKGDLFKKVVNLDAGGDNVRVALMATGHAFAATNVTWGSVSANEIASAAGYTTGGLSLASLSVTVAATTKWDAVDAAWNTATFTAYHAVIYDDTVTGDDLIASIDFGGAKTVASGTFTIQWHADGIITLA
jgi:hypothetical protein